ncbi:MAG TPA: DUF882 domain-containing protein [Stellaceae bacterium]|nr:DUF882 domain-containing protein [Stellaceae bacterium]
MNSTLARRREFLIGSGLCLLLGGRALAAPSAPRRLSLTNANTGESFDGLYRDANGPIPEAIADLAVLLRDHHVNKVGPLDVATLDFLADVMEATSQTHATVLSAYRTPETNAKLAASLFGVAEKSQHLLGKALDVTFDTKLPDAHTAALKMSRGGVGWYPRSHFIHLDTGPPREWQMDSTGLDQLLAGGRHRQLTVAQRNRLRRAYARQEYLKRQKSKTGAPGGT